MPTLRDRCQAMLDVVAGASMNGSLSVDDLVDFVVAETGRRADTRLEESLPLCLYFKTKQDREEFVAAVREFKPDMIVRRLP